MIDEYSHYKFFKVFGCNLKEYFKTGINKNQNKYNTMAKDLIKEEKEINKVRSKKEIIIFIFASIIGIGVVFLLLVALLYLYDLIYSLIF